MHDFLMHLGAGAAVLVVAFGCFAMGWLAAATPRSRPGWALWFGFAHLLD